MTCPIAGWSNLDLRMQKARHFEFGPALRLARDQSNRESAQVDRTGVFSDLVWLPGQMPLHPDPEGQYSVVRFTAQTLGPYSVSASFAGFGGPRSCATIDVHILVNGDSLVDELIDSLESRPAFSAVLVTLDVQMTRPCYEQLPGQVGAHLICRMVDKLKHIEQAYSIEGPLKPPY